MINVQSKVLTGVILVKNGFEKTAEITPNIKK